MQHVNVLTLAVLMVVTHADVGALGDDVSELGSVGIHPRVVRQVHHAVIAVERTGQRLAKHIGAAAAIPLVRNHAVDTPAVERNGAVELTQQAGHMLGQELGTDTPALLTLREDVVGRHTSVQQVHEHRTTRTIIGTQRGTVGRPALGSLGDLVLTLLTVHSVNVSNEQGAVLGIKSRVNVQVPCPVTHSGYILR